MSGAVERSAKTGQAKDLAGGAGETVPLTPKENFEERPHPAERVWTQGEIDDELSDEADLAGDDELEADMNCGKYPGSNGCSLAGTEWCDWSCPYSR